MRSLCLVLLALLCCFESRAGDAGAGAEPATPLAGQYQGRSEAAIRQQLLAVMDSQLDVREDLVRGRYRNSGPQVEAYLKVIGLGKGYAWCAAFVVWCCRQVGLKMPAYGMAHDFFSARTVIWPHVAGAAPPQPGDIVGYRFVRHDVDHTGFVRFWGTAPMAETQEGNTSSRRAEREGQGVYKKWVLKSQIYQVANLFKCLRK